jgi:hypothetical protein
MASRPTSTSSWASPLLGRASSRPRSWSWARHGSGRARRPIGEIIIARATAAASPGRAPSVPRRRGSVSSSREELDPKWTPRQAGATWPNRTKPPLVRRFRFRSGRLDLNQRPFGPQPNALPDCATPRGGSILACLARARRIVPAAGPCRVTPRNPRESRHTPGGSGLRWGRHRVVSSASSSDWPVRSRAYVAPGTGLGTPTDQCCTVGPRQCRGPGAPPFSVAFALPMPKFRVAGSGTASMCESPRISGGSGARCRYPNPT